MKKTLLALAVALAATAVPTIASAQVAFNAAVVTDYRYRGISQSKLKPAVSAGVDYAAGAFYVGAWASSIKWIDEAGGSGNVEIDLYGGYKAELAKDVTLDVGVLSYVYPSNKLATSANTTELYGAVTFGPEGPRVILSDRPDLPETPGIVVRLCAQDGCRTALTVSGQSVELGTQRLEVLGTARGEVLVTTGNTVWPFDRAALRLSALNLESLL
jgi:hypothetical protein